MAHLIILPDVSSAGSALMAVFRGRESARKLAEIQRTRRLTRRSHMGLTRDKARG